MGRSIEADAQAIAAVAERHLAALVAVSSPSGDRAAAEECFSVAEAMLPAEASVQRIPCSSPDHADDLVARLAGAGRGRILLVGHVDTVVAHGQHEPLRTDGERLVGSGSIDMKGGDVIVIEALRALAQRPADYAEVALLLVCDEEWRLGDFVHVERFAGFDACLCFEAGQVDPDGRDAVVVRRKAAGSIRITAQGRSAHSGSKPQDGINALLALAAAAQVVAAASDPDGPDHLTAVPTVMRSGDALNVVPADGELICDVRATTLEAIERVIAAIPSDVGGATLKAENLRRWPGMDLRSSAAGILAAASELLGREIVGGSRGGASDASHFAGSIPLCIDGLGPLGGLAHAPGEYVERSSFQRRSEVALALVEAVLASF